MRTPLIAIGLLTSTLALALSDGSYLGYSVLQSRELDRLLLRRSPADNTASSSKVSSKRNSPDSSRRKGFEKDRQPVTQSSKDETSLPAPRKPSAIGVVQAAFPAQGFMLSGKHGEWTTRPKPNVPSMAKIKHPDQVCVGGSCYRPNGVLTADVVGSTVTTRVDSRAGGTVHIADHENMNAEPRWRSYSPGKRFSITTTAEGNTLARHHARLEGAGSLEGIASMGSSQKKDSSS